MWRALDHCGADPGLVDHCGADPGLVDHCGADPGLVDHCGADPGLVDHSGADTGLLTDEACKTITAGFSVLYSSPQEQTAVLHKLLIDGE